MTMLVPRIDSRTSREVVEQVKELLAAHTAEWPEFHPDKGASRALIEIFGRFAELIIARLNQVPEKNFLAFLDMIGASLLPPQPARAPLTFSLVNGSIQDGRVPAGTQIAAVQAEGETTPVIFETEEELVVTAAQLVSVFVREPLDFYEDNTLLINSVSTNGVPAFRGRKDLQHIFYLGHDTLFSYPGLQQLKMEFNATKEPSVSLKVDWEKWDGRDPWTRIPASTNVGGPETTEAKEYLSKSGQVFFNKMSPLRLSTVAGIETCWLRCRLLDPTVPNDDLLPEIDINMTATINPPHKPGISMTATIGNPPGKPLPIEAAFTNTIQVDTTKDFFPFGERPRVGDTLYLANKEAFSEKDAVVTLNVDLRSAGAEKGNPQVTWEFWDGQMWSPLRKDFSDSTKAFTQFKGGVAFTFPEQPQASTINGVESFWVRVRIVSGNYGAEAHYELDGTGKRLKIDDQTKGYTIIPSTFGPPSISSITVGYTLTKESAPQIGLAYNDYHTFEVCFGAKTFKLPTISPVAAGYTLTKQSESEFTAFKPFRPMRDTDPILYLGFTIPSGLDKFPNRKINLYASLAEFKDSKTPTPVSPSGARKASPGAGTASDEQPKLVWQYSSGAGWAELTVRDSTDSLRKSGLIEFLAPADFNARDEFGLSRYWLRVVWKSGNYLFEPELRGLLLNTAMAAQAVTIKDEILGSSDGSKNQKFHTTRTPILEGQQLYVREPEKPPASELKVIEAENAGDALHLITDDTGRPKEIWVRWQQAPDFYGSGPRDRHFVLDHLTGEVSFGDGHTGLIPPTGVGNIRMSLYRTGGGVSGNKPAGTITQLRTTVPYVDRVTNHIAASGGAEAETYESLLHRMPRTLRHGNRAVTFEDYEDLAMLASPETARAKCEQVTDRDDPEKLVLGKLKLIVVPHSANAQPGPSLELKRRVLEFIGARKNPMVDVEVVKPSYVEVTVTVTVCPASLEIANDLRLTVTEQLTHFLHPLAGGFDRTGWDFGRQPHLSDLYHLIEAIRGVDHVITLEMRPVEFPLGNFLVSSGKHVVACEFKGA